MARGRMISSEITRDKKINELSSDTSRLAFTWLITFADAEGRTYGDPAIVRSLVFPRRGDVTIEQTEAFITEWAAAGLIIWYKANDDLWISFPNFARHQPGLRKDKEAPSLVPPPSEQLAEYSVPMTELGRTNSVPMAEQIPVNRIELKRIESAPDGASAPQEPEQPIEYPAIVKNVGAFKALKAFEDNQIGEDLSWLDEYLWPLARQFIVSTGIKPTKGEQSRWRKDLRVFFESSVSPPWISEAVNKMRHEGLTIKSPGSVYGIARDLMAKHKSGPDEVVWETH